MEPIKNIWKFFRSEIQKITFPIGLFMIFAWGYLATSELFVETIMLYFVYEHLKL